MNITRDDAMAQMRAARREYDQGLSPGDRAVLRRCREPAEIMLEAAFWRLAANARDIAPSHLAPVVLLFAACDAARPDGRPFGRYLNRHLTRGKKVSPGAALRVRRLLASPDIEVLTARLRRLLASIGAPIDWGVLGADLNQWQRSSRSADEVLRQWAQHFYAPMFETTERPSDEGASDSKETGE